jgi:hypothetical protein
MRQRAEEGLTDVAEGLKWQRLSRPVIGGLIYRSLHRLKICPPDNAGRRGASHATVLQ